MKIGIFGGTFDPIHYGHIELAKKAKEQFELDRLLFVPAYVSPHKIEECQSSSQDRCEMVKAALSEFPEFELSTIEIDREGVSYMVDTLQSLKSQYPNDELCLLMGEDSHKKFSTWRDPEKIQKLAQLLVAPRIDEDSRDLSSGAEAIDMRLYKISASEIRQDVKMGKAISDKVPPAVEKMIKQKGLYT